MRGRNETHELFGGLARRKGWKDAAVVALWLALVAGFVAQVTPAAPPARPAEATFAAVTTGPAARSWRAPERPARPVVLVETVRYP
jgi:hypothetical protein